MGLTTDRSDPKLHQKGRNGQNESYLILSEEERAKGFVRPRCSYVHKHSWNAHDNGRSDRRNVRTGSQVLRSDLLLRMWQPLSS